MSSRTTRFWTLNSLVDAYLDLFIAYFLLCGSSVAFFVGKFLGFFGLSLQSPYNGLFGIPNSDFTNLLVECPIDKISSVQLAVTRKFPFDSIFFKMHNNNANRGLNLDRNDVNGDGFRKLEGEASCSSKSDARKVFKNETADSGYGIERGKGFDVKGKGGLNYRVRGGFRRRRKGSLDSGKHSFVSSSPNWITCIDQQSNQKEENGGFEDEAETPQITKSEDENGARERISLNDDDKHNRIILLAHELEEEQAARAALYIELEKERNAAATAADEAMAMILRLQEEKASIEMESRQYQRMIEEKSAYDEEEMNILKEIVLRREREKHFLEKEVEAYRQIIGLENDQDLSEDPDVFLHQLSLKFAKRKNSRSYEEDDSSKQNDIEKTIAIVDEEQQSLEKNYKDIYDVHVVDHENENKNKNQKSTSSVDDVDRGFLRRLSEATTVGLPPMSSRSLRRNSTSALDSERMRIDTEVDWLRERLRIVQEGREKLNFCLDNREKETLQLQLLEDITRQLQEIRMLTEPRKARQASLPLPSSKGLTKKRRCRSVSSGHAKSS